MISQWLDKLIDHFFGQNRVHTSPTVSQEVLEVLEVLEEVLVLGSNGKFRGAYSKAWHVVPCPQTLK